MNALIVGASRGIGEATAAHLTTAGWTVTDLSRATGCDATKRDDLADHLNTQRHVDAVVYCAGHVEPGSFLDVDLDTWDYHIEVNLTAAARVLQWAIRSGVGSVVLVASTAALRPSPGWAAYSAAKAGLVNLGLTVAVEAAGATRVYVVAPGRCATHLRAVLAPDEDPATIMQPAEVARVIGGLIADVDGVLAGQVVEVARRC